MDTTSVKLRTLIIMRILLQKTNEEHPMTAAGLAKELEYYDMTIDRKTVYKDIEILRDFGLDVQQARGTGGGYYVAGREFELAELKILVDSVQASKFITVKKSQELIKKLEHLTNEYEARQLQRNVYIYNRIKLSQETIYYIVDALHTAMLQNCAIRYQYCEWTVHKKLEPRRGGALYHVSPWALTWSDEKYYLIAYDHKTEQIRHYRVDKIRDIQICEEERKGKDHFQNFDLALFSKKMFGMYQGKDENVTFFCENRKIGNIIDRFGKECMVIPVDEKHFKINVPVSVSPRFFGWLTGLGEGIEILSPESVRIAYKEYLKDLLKKYE